MVQVALVLWAALQARLSFFSPYTSLTFVVDYLLNVGAILLAFTLYSDTPLLLNVLLLAPVIVVYAVPRSSPQKKKKVVPPKSPNDVKVHSPMPKKPFLTIYRGAMMITTCIAILAVDFRIFPRRFAKVENWGTSLMDVGVGSFVFSAGIVAARPLLKEKLAARSTSLSSRLWHSMRHSLPLLVLGLIRLYTVKGLDYAEHVTEYGVHWNFFFTLGCLPPFLAIFQSAFQLVPSYAALGIMLCSFYQIALEFTDLKGFILTGPRDNLFSKNREGIFSFFGYLAIFLAGQSTGMIVIPRSLSTKLTGGTAQRKRLLLTLGAWCVTWISLFTVTSSYKYGLNLTVSRRLANLPYFFWICAFNSCQITAFCIVETIFFPQAHQNMEATQETDNYQAATSRIFEAYNRNGLAIFLVANLLTGLVNLTVPTLHVNNIQAMLILFTYTSAVTGLAVSLDSYDISIKM